MSCNVVWCDRYTGEDCGITWCPAYLPRNTSNTIDVNTIITDDTDSDYVKVVRCKDCKHYGPAKFDIDGSTMYCNHPQMFTCYPIDPDFYCEYAERRETNG